ncbi:hypothetical protein FVER14953_21553 [Fusarium verticillioides]|nr:hypothetical protein FVER14953_21553 [Fusarium verticillioides]
MSGDNNSTAFLDNNDPISSGSGALMENTLTTSIEKEADMQVNEWDLKL